MPSGSTQNDGGALHRAGLRSEPKGWTAFVFSVRSNLNTDAVSPRRWSFPQSPEFLTCAASVSGNISMVPVFPRRSTFGCLAHISC